MERWTLKHYEELRDAIASGAAEIAFKDKRIRYNSPAQMRRLLKEMEEELGIGGERRPAARTPRFNNGL